MKAAILVLALAAPLAHAEKWMETPNKLGGKLILTTEVCTDKPAFRLMMSTAPNHKTAFGCWALVANMIHVIYNDGDVYTYDPEAFTLVDTDKPKTNKYNY